MIYLIGVRDKYNKLSFSIRNPIIQLKKSDSKRDTIKNTSLLVPSAGGNQNDSPGERSELLTFRITDNPTSKS